MDKRQQQPMTDETVAIELRGPTGNAMYVIGAVRRALRKAGLASEIESYTALATAGSYEQLLALSRRYVNLVTV